MITIYPANRYPTETLTDVVHRSVQALREAVSNLEMIGQSTVAERATLDALQAALDRHCISSGGLLSPRQRLNS